MDVSYGLGEDLGYSVERPSVEGVLSAIESGVGLDIAKRHSGVVTWLDGELKRYGFELPDTDSTDPHALYRLRVYLKDELEKILSGNSFEYCIIEDTYGGVNYDTLVKLVTLNTVIDELIFEGIITVKCFLRWKEAKWLKYFRKIYKIKGKPDVKYEVQEILGYLNDEFYMGNKDLSNADKARIYFEDICDATGMLCAAAIYSGIDDTIVDGGTNLTMRNVWVSYQSEVSDEVLDVAVTVEYVRGKLEDFILELVRAYRGTLFCCELPSSKLGRFGIERGFTFHEGTGYLLFKSK